jgi:hypothetical protein
MSSTPPELDGPRRLVAIKTRDSETGTIDKHSKYDEMG